MSLDRIGSMKKLISLLLLGFSVSSFATKDGGGGDPGKIAVQLKTDQAVAATHALIWFFDLSPNLSAPYSSHLASILDRINPDYIFDEEARKIFLDMKAKGLIEDVPHTKIKLRDKCVIYRKGEPQEVTGGTLMDIPRSEVCINPYRFVDSTGGVLKESLFLGFMLHEYSHHYGYLDLDHSFARAMTDAIELSNSSSRDPDLLDYYYLQTRFLHKRDKDYPYIQEWNRCILARDCFTPKPASGITVITN